MWDRGAHLMASFCPGRFATQTKPRFVVLQKCLNSVATFCFSRVEISDITVVLCGTISVINMWQNIVMNDE